MHTTFGPIVLLGSGETSLAGGRIFESIAQGLPCPLRIAILETPAGFELNSLQVAGRVGEYLKVRLKNYNPIIEIVPARKRNTVFSPDNMEILNPLLDADLLFMGAGSPTYAVKQLLDSLAWNIIRARHRQGAALVFTSAATISVGASVLPVYEIYKVGEEITCPAGLNIFADFGLMLSCVPHWNNTDGGADMDTSRCFIGMERFTQWCDMLPAGSTILGLDEHTGVIIDFALGHFSVHGVSSITLLRDCKSALYPTGSTAAVEALGPVYCPQIPEEGIPAAIWEMVRNRGHESREDEIPEEVLRLLEERKNARDRKEWKESDAIREKIARFGWVVQDTPTGQNLVKA